MIASAGPRASLADIAAAAGILAGSLYHHFSTKEELLLELVQGFHADIDEVANAALDDTGHLHTGPFPAAIYDFGSAIARCAVRHPAALQMSFFEAPSANPSLAQLLSARPTTLQYTMTQILAAGVANGLLRSPVALSALADRICQSLMHVGLDVIRHNADAEDVATLLCRIMTTGLSTRAPTDDELDSSAAFAAAEKTIGSWGEDSHVEVTGESAYIHAVAREQFGRRGYEVTTMRDIIKASALGPARVYSVVGSKDKLFRSIMEAFGRKASGGFAEVLASDATAVEKLDALSWVNINAIDRFPDEWKIQLAWLRQHPPDTPEPGLAFAQRLDELESLLREGTRSHNLQAHTSSLEMLARCVIGVLWIPENLVHRLGRRAALRLARDTVIRGIADRSLTPTRGPART
ncbi:TetR/AcrR family transcriptional regulator [Mycobacterium intracellulare]|uniref:TetR/AcrR family transcriptional regulator n=1 Tax=Mycobacterium intracellulare TaxID=1767 RepID=UPI001E4852DA|nr:TetR/AcrR family transcriptional regulator [Mycobacterium intracellulare]UGT99163.1 TetR/AcrR family transcriptional regulator [Mycobacterium intracellulare]